MKKRLILAVLSLAATTIIPIVSISAVHANSVSVFPSGCGADICKDNASGSKTNPIFGPSGIMTEVIHLLAIFVGTIAVISILIAGFMMVSAGGDATKVANARRALLYAIVGLAVAAIAQMIVAFVLDKIAP